MTILTVAYPLLPVGPDAGGGAEQIASLVERGMVAAGHRSIVIAAPGSETSGELIESAAAPLRAGDITDDVRRNAQRIHRECIGQALERYPIDLIHFHGLDFFSYVPQQDLPMLATLHLPVSFYPASIFEDARVQLNCVSHTQARSVTAQKKFPVVCNGIETRQYRNGSGEKRSLLSLGRICPEKGVHIALDAALRLDTSLVIAGPVHPFRDHQRYFADCIEPLLDEKRRYIGSVNLETKKALLAGAKCLLIPSLVAETSSLVAMEAISAGTPVIAFRSGALPEIVEHGETGFIVDSPNEMGEAVQRVSAISAETCRLRAQLRFDAERMVDGYSALYRFVVQGRTLASAR